MILVFFLNTFRVEQTFKMLRQLEFWILGAVTLKLRVPNTSAYRVVTAYLFIFYRNEMRNAK